MTKQISTSQNESLLQLYITEYQALRTGATYWSFLQYGLLPVVPVYLGLIANIWGKGTFIKWLSFAGLQMIGIFWSQTMLEQFTVVKYLECHLRPLINKLVSSELFFGWEPYLVTKRHISPIWGALFIPLLNAVLFLILLIFRIIEGGISIEDFGGMAISLFLLGILIRNCYASNRLMIEWSNYDKYLAKKISDIHEIDISEN